ncbi:unnamed protein product, partial [Penicillium salamii]
MAANGTQSSDFTVKAGLAQMLKGGVIMDVVNAEQARIAEEAGAAAVMALERVPADIRVEGGVARMSDPTMIKEIMEAVTIPVMAKARIGHFVECQVSSIALSYSPILSPLPRRGGGVKWRPRGGGKKKKNPPPRTIPPDPQRPRSCLLLWGWGPR